MSHLLFRYLNVSPFSGKGLSPFTDKLQKREKKGLKDLNIDDIIPIEEEEKVIKKKKISIKPMSQDEAILQMELLGHNFYLYKDSDTNDMTVIYKRKDGGYGIIESE